MCLEESFCPFTWDALGGCTTQQCPCLPSPSAIITAPCDAQLYHSVTAHAHRKSKVYVMLVYLLLL